MKLKYLLLNLAIFTTFFIPRDAFSIAPGDRYEHFNFHLNNSDGVLMRNAEGLSIIRERLSSIEEVVEKSIAECNTKGARLKRKITLADIQRFVINLGPGDHFEVNPRRIDHGAEDALLERIKAAPTPPTITITLANELFKDAMER